MWKRVIYFFLILACCCCWIADTNGLSGKDYIDIEDFEDQIPTFLYGTPEQLTTKLGEYR